MSKLRTADEVVATIRKAFEEEFLDPLCEELKELIGENAKLRAALDPFADQAVIIDSQEEGRSLTDEELFRLAGSWTALTVGDCRRARDLREDKA